MTVGSCPVVGMQNDLLEPVFRSYGRQISEQIDLNPADGVSESSFCFRNGV